MLKITEYFSGSFRQVLRVTEVDSIPETAVWPILIFINIVSALEEIFFHFYMHKHNNIILIFLGFSPFFISLILLKYLLALKQNITLFGQTHP